jgi:hypothetical protein
VWAERDFEMLPACHWQCFTTSCIEERGEAWVPSKVIFMALHMLLDPYFKIVSVFCQIEALWFEF